MSTQQNRYVSELKNVFNLFDKDGDGKISVEELGAVMKNIGQNPTKEELQIMLGDLDQDENGTIEFDEFVKLMERKVDAEDEIREAFKVFDKNNDGFISHEELKHMMQSIGENLSDREVNAMMKQADKDGNGLIDYEEFLKMFTQLQQQ
ncbi:hypothetical protein ABK040_013493 [Willaertia magna]